MATEEELEVLEQLGREIADALDAAQRQFAEIDPQQCMTYCISFLSQLSVRELGMRLGIGETEGDEAALRIALLVAKGAPQPGPVLVDVNLPATSIQEEEDEKSTLSDVDDAEVECYVLKEEEQEKKKRLWAAVHREWLLDKAAKDAATPQPIRRKSRRSKGEPQTAAEAADQLMERRLTSKSSRINWEALQVPQLIEQLEQRYGQGASSPQTQSNLEKPAPQTDSNEFAVYWEHHNDQLPASPTPAADADSFL